MIDRKLKCIIVDDEPRALNLVKSYVDRTPFLDNRAQFNNAISALTFLNVEPIDIVFLDIQMPDLDGLEFSRLIKNDIKIIFTTAFDQYAIEGYKVDAIDFLLKPFNYADFLNAANKARLRLATTHNEIVKEDQQSHSEANFLFVKSDYKQLKIDFENILYFEGLRDYIKIYLKDNPKPILTLMSLRVLEEKLPATKFKRIHRSFIIALANIDAVERNQVLINDRRITISEQYKSSFQKFIEKNSFL